MHASYTLITETHPWSSCPVVCFGATPNTLLGYSWLTGQRLLLVVFGRTIGYWGLNLQGRHVLQSIYTTYLLGPLFFVIVFFLCFWPLHIVLRAYSGIIPGDAQGTINWDQVECKVNAESTLLSVWSHLAQ